MEVEDVDVDEEGVEEEEIVIHLKINKLYMKV
jgi:hypothetical protein